MPTITRQNLHEVIDQLPEPALTQVADFLDWIDRQWRNRLEVAGRPLNVPVKDAGLSPSARRERIHAESMAWRSFPVDLRKRYGQSFVAVYEGGVVDSDPDRLTLYRRIRGRFGDTPVLITPAAAESPRQVRLLTPHFERRP